jgi:predicted dehydrogenase
MQLTGGTLVSTSLIEDTIEHNSWEIIGERGRLVLSLYRYDGFQWFPRGKYDGSFALRAQHAGRSVQEMPRMLAGRRNGGDYVGTYRAEWDHLHKVLTHGTPPLATAADGAAATRIAEDARRALTKGSP